MLQKTTQLIGLIVSNGTSTPLASSHTQYTDYNYVPEGSSGNEYTLVNGPVTVPNTAKVNDSGLWFTTIRYANAGRTTWLGTSELAFALQPDTAGTAVLKVTETDKNSFGSTTFVTSAYYRMTPSGTLTRLSETGVSSTGTDSLTLTYL